MSLHLSSNTFSYVVSRLFSGHHTKALKLCLQDSYHLIDIAMHILVDSIYYLLVGKTSKKAKGKYSLTILRDKYNNSPKN